MKKVLSFTTVIVVWLYTLAAATDLPADHQTQLIKSVDGYAQRISEVALKIWSTPELGSGQGPRPREIGRTCAV
jgi:hypothetical protein